MRPVTRLLTAAAAMTLGALALVPTAQAAKPPPLTFTVGDTSAYEYTKDCSTQGPPFACTSNSTIILFGILTYPPVQQDVTFGYQIDAITATQGADYIGTTGTTVMRANTNFSYVQIPIIMDGVAEPSETLRFRITSSSIGGNINDSGIGTIVNDGQIPADCTLTRPSLMVTSMSCTNRPPTQQWQIEITCYDGGGWGYVWATGEIITGNGTSTAVCDRVDYEYGWPAFRIRL